jgi:glycosyltransferase involved in cell wall biosynthesis
MPTLSVVIETFNWTPESKVQLEHVLAQLDAQTLPREEIERVVVVDAAHPEQAETVKRLDPSVTVVLAPEPTYYGMKRCGIQHARGDIIALLDSDTVPVDNWAAEIVSTIRLGADVVAGKVRFPRDAPFSRTFAIFDYGHLRNDRDGQASCFNVSNCAIRADVAARHVFDDRLTRFGGGTLLGRQLSSMGYRIIYNPAVSVVHNDKGLKKHIGVRFRTGHEAVKLCRLDDARVLSESKFMKFGLTAPFIFAAQRAAYDCRTVVAARRDFDIAWYEVPYFISAAIVVRSMEACAGVVSVLRPGYFERRFGW